MVPSEGVNLIESYRGNRYPIYRILSVCEEMDPGLEDKSLLSTSKLRTFARS